MWIHTQLAGEEARVAIRALERAAADYADAANYWAYPGPNSNTFAERMARAAGVPLDLHHNAVGKDWSWLRIGPSSTRTGVELETPLLGIQLGLREGIELHVLQLTFGIDFWPPALLLPGAPRLGF